MQVFACHKFARVFLCMRCSPVIFMIIINNSLGSELVYQLFDINNVPKVQGIFQSFASCNNSISPLFPGHSGDCGCIFACLT